MNALNLALIHALCCFVAGREISKTLKVNNGGPWGQWQQDDFCPVNSYAIGYEMKIEFPLGPLSDDTALNGIRLICGDSLGTADGSHAVSGSGKWGWWRGPTLCEKGQAVTGFRLQVEGDQGKGDDTAANYMRVRCRQFGKPGLGIERYPGNGIGSWGTFGSWSKSCDANSAVCGIRTKVEPPKGNIFADDTALNDVQLYCCPLN